MEIPSFNDWAHALLTRFRQRRSKRPPLTEQEMCDDVITKLSDEDIAWVRGERKLHRIESIMVELNICRYIRNEYGLWHSHPLTKRWRDNPNDRDIRDGVDWSEDHPDAVSHRVYELVTEKLQLLDKGLA